MPGLHALQSTAEYLRRFTLRSATPDNLATIRFAAAQVAPAMPNLAHSRCIPGFSDNLQIEEYFVMLHNTEIRRCRQLR